MDRVVTLLPSSQSLSSDLSVNNYSHDSDHPFPYGPLVSMDTFYGNLSITLQQYLLTCLMVHTSSLQVRNVIPGDAAHDRDPAHP